MQNSPGAKRVPPIISLRSRQGASPFVGEGAGPMYSNIAVQAQPDGIDGAEDDGITDGSGVAHIWRQHCKGNH
jgi:hypothetical protein